MRSRHLPCVAGPTLVGALRASAPAMPAALTVLVLLLGLTWPVLVPAPASALDAVQVQQPPTDAVITGPVAVQVRIDAAEGEFVDDVIATFPGPPAVEVALERQGPPELDGTQVWRAEVDPLAEGAVIANGAQDLTIQPVLAAGDQPEPTIRPVTVAVRYVGELVAAPTGEDPLVVALSWDPVELPDFLAYRIDRRADDADGFWEPLQRIEDVEVRDTTDELDEPGRYRYRLVVVRSDGADGEVLGYSPTRGVQADPDEPGTFDPDPEPSPTPTPPEPTPTPTAEPGTGSGGGGGPLGRPGGGQPEPAPTPTPTSRQTPQVSVRPPPAPAPAPAPPRPSVVPLDDGVFEPLLPIDDTETELVFGETESAFLEGEVRPGGTVAVLTEQAPDRTVYVAAAGGLLLVVLAGHVRRWLGAASRR